MTKRTKAFTRLIRRLLALVSALEPDELDLTLQEQTEFARLMGKLDVTYSIVFRSKTQLAQLLRDAEKED